MKHHNSEVREVRTTILEIDREAIDWELLRQNFYIVCYDVRGREWGESPSKYYSSMHIWYKQESDFPCYLHTHGPRLYVKYSYPDQVVPLSYQGQLLSWRPVDFADKNLSPEILKVLVADFFRVDARFVSNADFFLWAAADKDFVTGLSIEVKHNWQENNDQFVVSDQAARLRKLRPFDFDSINDWKRKNRVYYGRFYIDGMAVFKQLRANQLTRTQQKEGIYEVYKGSPSDRASLTFHSVKSLRALQQTRSYLLDHFVGRFVAYLNRLGLPFRQKLLPMEAMHTKTTAEMQGRQLPLERKPVCVVDDRLNARRKPDDFVTRFCDVANATTTDHEEPLFVVKAETDLVPGDWVLRLQDYDGDEFDPESGVLKDWQDNKATFYDRHPDIVKQTLNVNGNSKRRQKEAQRKKSRTWSADDYLEYPVPAANDIKTVLEVIRNQLLLKDVVMYPEDVCGRLPQTSMMAGMIFLYQGAMVYFDGRDLQFIPVVNNLEAASAFVRAHTGWDLLEDVLLPSIEQYYFNPERDGVIEDTLKRPFIIGRDFVWEIWEGNGRVVYENDVIKERLEALEETIPRKSFYPAQPIEGNPLFTAQQLQAYARFLDEHVRESTISYLDLKKRYGKHIRDERGAILVENGGFFGLLGIQNDSKFRRYLREYLGLTLESIREDHLFPVHKGIWYSPDTNHYVAGVKDANTGEQEHGHTMRRIIVHQGEREQGELQTLLAKLFFPLLEVNFIRHRNFTVLPFPFRLIEMWQKIDE